MLTKDDGAVIDTENLKLFQLHSFAGADLGVGEGGQPPTLSFPLPTHRFSPNEDIQ